MQEAAQLGQEAAFLSMCSCWQWSLVCPVSALFDLSNPPGIPQVSNPSSIHYLLACLWPMTIFVHWFLAMPGLGIAASKLTVGLQCFSTFSPLHARFEAQALLWRSWSQFYRPTLKRWPLFMVSVCRDRKDWREIKEEGMRKKDRDREADSMMIFPKSVVPFELTVCKYRSSAQQSEHQKINISN